MRQTPSDCMNVLLPFLAPSRRRWRSPTLLLVLAVWLTTVGNLPLWWSVGGLPEIHGLRAWVGVAALAGVLLALSVALLNLLVWPPWVKPAGWLLLLAAAVGSYFMASYGVVIDPGMVGNALHTDAREVRDLLSWPLGGALVLGVLVPGWWWGRQSVHPAGWAATALRQLGLALLGLLVAVLLAWFSFQDLASLMRNHKSLRYMVNPFNTGYALARSMAGSVAQAPGPLAPIGLDARLTAVPADPAQAPLVVLVVGETARAANFGLAGYARDTTPRLKQLQTEGDLLYFSGVHSCGTSTQASLPCMFSHLGKNGFEAKSGNHEGLLDVLQRAGLAVLWLDNQSGCKGVCDRVPTVETRSLALPQWCEGDECHDEAMLHVLPQHLAALDEQRRARGTVVVMHQMGSHGPAYYKRTPPAKKTFFPECVSSALQECPVSDVVNAYDNTIRYTDHFLAETVAWLKQQPRPTALVYVSDHGESLGEEGMYLHGMPYAVAPQEQRHVPMAVWLSPSMQAHVRVDMACARSQAVKPWTHDNLFHSVLGLAQVQTAVRQPALDVLGPCAT